MKKKETTEERKKLQKAVDDVLIKNIKASKQALLKKYLAARFSLNNGMYPHQLKF